MMGWFKQQYLSWMIVSAAAVCVSSQELTSTLRNRSHACRGEEVIFTCTIRGSTDVSTLILAWSSPEYIGQGDPLRFTTDNVPGTNRTSTINENVTVILINNTNINGVPILVSELRIVTDQASTVTCQSVTTSSTMSMTFHVSDAPEAPLSVGATAVFQLENECDILVKWDPPANSFDIDHYIVYVPSLNMDANETSLISTIHLLRDCPESLDIKVAAVNRFGCVGISSTVTLQSTSPALPTSQSPESSTSQSSTPESSAMSLSAVVGGASAGIILFVLIIAANIIALVVGLYRQQKKGYQKLHAEYHTLHEDIKESAVQSAVEVLQDLLLQLYVGLRSESHVEIQIAAKALVRKVDESSNKDYIQKAMINILETIDLKDYEYFLKALKYVKVIIPDLSKISNKLEETHAVLVQAMESGNGSELQTRFEELKHDVKDKKSSDFIKNILLKVCNKLVEELAPRKQTQGQAENPVYSEGTSQQQLEAQIEQTATAAESGAMVTNSNPMEGHMSIAMYPIKPADGRETTSTSHV